MDDPAKGRSSGARRGTGACARRREQRGQRTGGDVQRGALGAGVRIESARRASNRVGAERCSPACSPSAARSGRARHGGGGGDARRVWRTQPQSGANQGFVRNRPARRARRRGQAWRRVGRCGRPDGGADQIAGGRIQGPVRHGGRAGLP